MLSRADQEAVPADSTENMMSVSWSAHTSPLPRGDKGTRRHSGLAHHSRREVASCTMPRGHELPGPDTALCALLVAVALGHEQHASKRLCES